MKWDDGLHGVARAVAASSQTVLRVLAGPGTGKTFALMRRVARLLQEGASPSRVLVSTFTRNAASDLRKELQQLGVDGVEDVCAETLHTLCFRILHRQEVLSLIGRVPRPLLEYEQRFLLEDVKKAAGGVRKASKGVRAFAAAWARLQHETPGWPQGASDKALHSALIDWLKFHEAMLIGEVVPETLRYLRENPLSPERSAYDHVLVDEYQDLNRAEQVLLDVLAEGGALGIVGDEDQSIYSFKHAHPQGIVDFEKFHPKTENHVLADCRRCPKLIVDLANRLIANNADRQPRSLQPLAANPTGEVHVVQWPSIEEEANGLAQFIRNRIGTASAQPGQVLVLTPRRQVGYAIRDALNKGGTPSHSFFQEEALDGDPKELAESQAQQAFALLTLKARPDDRAALRAWCGFGSPSLLGGAWARLRAHCEQAGESPRAALERLDRGEFQLAHTGSLVERYRLLLEELKRIDGLKGPQLTDAVFVPGQDWAEPLRTALKELTGNASPSRVHSTLASAISQPELPTDVDYVRIMSLHKSKGLTADVVVIAGCVEGLIPTTDEDMTPQEAKALEEEQRRLFYVAITRSRRVLVLSSVTMLPTAMAFKVRARIGMSVGGSARTIPSRFLDELGPSRPIAIDGKSLLMKVKSL